MQQERQRISRIRRLREIDDGRLNQLAVELGAIEQQVKQWSDHLANVQCEIRESLHGSSEGVVTRRQSGVWTDHLHQVSVRLAKSIQFGASERDRVHGKMIDQRAKVRGWDLLLERLEGEMNAASEKVQHQEADDRFLNNETVN